MKVKSGTVQVAVGGTRPREDRTVLLVTTVWLPVASPAPADASQLPLSLKTGPLSSVTSQINNDLAPVVDQQRAINVAENGG